MELLKILHEQKKISLSAFGPKPRLLGVHDHLKKEIEELYRNPKDRMEWADCFLLCIDGAMRSGWTPERFCEWTGLENKEIRVCFCAIYNHKLSRLSFDVDILKDSIETPRAWGFMACKIFIAAFNHGDMGWSELLTAVNEKLQINKTRNWPDWRTVGENKAIEHIENYSKN